MLSVFPEHIRALIFALAALAGCWLVLRVCRAQLLNSDRLLAAWGVVTVAAFVAPGFIVFSLVVLAVCRWLRPQTDADRVVIFVALLPAIAKINYMIPGFAGINYLFTLNYVRVLTLILLLPILLSWMTHRKNASPANSQRLLAADALFVAYLFWSWIAASRGTSITDSLRLMFETGMFVALPYFVISRTLRTEEDFKRVAMALLLSAMAVGMVALLEQRTDWWFYRYLPERLSRGLDGWWSGQETRGGLIRVKSTIDGGLAYLMMFGFAALLFLRREQNNWRLTLAATLILGLTIWFTGARGPVIATALMIAILAGFRFVGSRAKFMTATIVGLVSLPWIERLIASLQDDYGTFSYRQELLASSLPLIWERFLFGFSNIRELEGSGRLEHLRQGEGIIDIVNHYLWIGLLSGGVALTLYLGLLLASILGVLGRNSIALNTEENFQAAVRRTIVALLVSTAFLIATISVGGHMTDYIWLLIAMASGYSHLYGGSTTATSRLGPRKRPVIPGKSPATASRERTWRAQ